MKKVFFCAALFLSLASVLFAVDEDSYIQFTADSIIVAHRFKGNPKAMNLWVDEMQKRYPDFMSQDWQSFEERIAKDGTLKDRVYNRILSTVRSNGYNARIVDIGRGATTIEIKD